MSLSLHIAQGNRKTLSRQERIQRSDQPELRCCARIVDFYQNGGAQ
jgi:hypothetical protein